MKIKDLQQIIDHLDADGEIMITVIWNGDMTRSVSTYDIGYEINDGDGELLLQVAVFDSDLERSDEVGK